MAAISQQLADITVLSIVVRILLSTFCAGTLGFERERHNQAAGFRTYIIVSDASALVMMTNIFVAGIGETDLVRMSASVITGLGFLGAGTIFMSDRKISGLTTAASLWCTACIGLAAGAGYLGAAVISGLVVLVVLRLMQRVVRITTYKRLEVQFIHRTETLAFLNEVFAQMEVKVLDVNFHAESRPEGNQYTNVYTLSMPNRARYVEIIGVLSENRNILKVGTRDV